MQTDSRRLATKRARIYRIHFDNILDELMEEKDETIDNARHKIADSLKNEMEVTLPNGEKKTIDVMKDAIPDSLKGTFSALQTTLKGENVATLPNDEKKVITGVIKRNLLEGEDTTPHKEYLVTQLRKEAQQEEEKVIRQQNERRAEELHQAQLATIAISQTKTPAITQPAGSKLPEHLKEYIEFQTSLKDNGKKDGDGKPLLTPIWNEKGAGRLNPPKLEFFCSTVQDKATSTLTWEDIDNYVELAHALPKNFNHEGHASKFQGLSVDQLLDTNIQKPDYEARLASAVRGDFKAVIAFLRWTQKRKRVQSLLEPIDSLDLAIKDIHYESTRRAFTLSELKILFEQDNSSPENYVIGFRSKRRIDANLKYWLPLLGLYTGAAIAELCQLHVSDVFEHPAFDGSLHWVIDINDDKEKRLKNKYRARLIPIHKNLIAIGLLDYVSNLKSKNEEKLFPTAKRKIGHFGTESQWWGEYSGNAGVTDKDVVFHSFRHCLCSFLADNHFAESLVTAISGHNYTSMAKTTYYRKDKRGQDIAPLVKVINSINYGLEHPNFLTSNKDHH